MNKKRKRSFSINKNSQILFESLININYTFSENSNIDTNSYLSSKKIRNNINNTISIPSQTSELIQIEFTFSCVKDPYFSMIKNLIKPLFYFEDISINGITDLIYQLREDVGTTIINEGSNEDEDSIFAIFSLIPFNYYKNNLTIIQIKNYLINKINTLQNKSLQDKALYIIKNNKIGLIINERIINLPQNLVPLGFNFINNEINECKECEDYKGKFELDYILLISKYVIDNYIIDNHNKKQKGNSNSINNCVLYYKDEINYFVDKSEVKISYKIPYIENDMEILENESQPQYICILFVKYNTYIDIINSIH